MKKLLYILMMFIIAFSACDPNEDIYDELDGLREPYKAPLVSLTFTADDYDEAEDYALIDAVSKGDADSSIAKQIGSMEAFNLTYTAEEYVGKVVGDMFPEYGKGSAAMVTYSNYLGIAYLDSVGSPEDEYELLTADYDAMGTGEDEPGEHGNFSSSVAPEDWLPTYMLTLYPDAEEGYMVIITYKYYSGTTSNLEGYLYFDGTEWMMLSNSYELVDADYDEMGSGPGQYNNFSSSAKPEDYLPIWLKLNHPYDKEGTVRTIIYKYYSGSTLTLAQEYSYDGTSWIQNDGMVEATNQFINNGTAWLFDPTITVEMSSSNYQFIVDYIRAKYGDELLNSYLTAEFVYGTDSYYSEFDINDFDPTHEEFSDLEDPTWEDGAERAIGTILLPELFPDATLQVNGVDMYYRVIFLTYNYGAEIYYAMKFQVTKAGPDPEFTLVETEEL